MYLGINRFAVKAKLLRVSFYCHGIRASPWAVTALMYRCTPALQYVSSATWASPSTSAFPLAPYTYRISCGIAGPAQRTHPYLQGTPWPDSQDSFKSLSLLDNNCSASSTPQAKGTFCIRTDLHKRPSVLRSLSQRV